MTFTHRPSQQNILRYNGGRLGIAAVLGAGKTHILSAIAAQRLFTAARCIGWRMILSVRSSVLFRW